jgi:hypothetical protein
LIRDKGAAHWIDLILALQLSNRTKTVLCEIDRDPDGDFTILDQVGFLWRFFESGAAEGHGLEHARVCVLSRSEKRMNQVVDRVPAYYDHDPKGHGRFWFSTLIDLDVYEQFTWSRWRSGDHRWHSIVD